MDKIARIRQEIERRMKIYKESNYGISLRYQELEELLSFLDTLSEEPDKSLEEAIMEYYGNIPDDKDKVDAARHFAEWGAEHLRDTTKMIDKGLEEAADEYAYQGISEEMKSELKPIGDEVIKNFKAGAEWQKAKMMKGAEECDLYYDGDFLAIDLNMAALGYSERDNVKVIVLKDNEDESE